MMKPIRWAALACGLILSGCASLEGVDPNSTAGQIGQVIVDTATQEGLRALLIPACDELYTQIGRNAEYDGAWPDAVLLYLPEVEGRGMTICGKTWDSTQPITAQDPIDVARIALSLENARKLARAGDP